MHKVFTPDWAMFTGYNDRFLMGARDSVMHVMSRLDHVAEFCNTYQKPLHSERYLKWLLNNYTRRANSERTNPDGSHHFATVQTVHSFYFRRLRANAGLVHQQYLHESEKKMPLDDMKVCSEHALANYTKDWAP